MPKKRITYLNWIVDIGVDPSRIVKSSEVEPDPVVDEELEREVDKALKSMTDEEQELMRQFHFMGRSYVQIADDTGREIYKLASTHKRCLKKLKSRLASFVSGRFGIEIPAEPKCSVCASPFRAEIDCIISLRDKRATWKPVIQAIGEQYGLRIRAPQLLIGHERYH